MVLRLNESLKFAESIMSSLTGVLRPGTNCRPCQQWIHQSSRVFDNAREDPFPLPQIFMLKEVHLRQLAT